MALANGTTRKDGYGSMDEKKKIILIYSTFRHSMLVKIAGRYQNIPFLFSRNNFGSSKFDFYARKLANILYDAFRKRCVINYLWLSKYGNR